MFHPTAIRTATVHCMPFLFAVMIALLGPDRLARGQQDDTRPDEAAVADSPASDADAVDMQDSVEDLLEQVRQSVVTIQTDGRDGDRIGTGTGFIVDSDGLIATNLHVIAEGRRFEVQLHDGSLLKVIAIEASDRAEDLALIRVDPGDKSLRPLPLADGELIKQGREVIAIGNPLGLRNSVVRGVVSAIRNIDGRDLIQLAMPIQPGNSGGPLIDFAGRVHGILNMKSAVDDNLGFAIPIQQLIGLQSQPNPVLIDRWIRFGRIDSSRWEPIFGAHWQQRAGVISVAGEGKGFGGRSLCLLKQPTPEEAFDVAVDVRLNDESGAAGLVFHSDGKDRHYGFYPTAGKLRLSCFRGPDVFSWQVLDEVSSDAYRPGDWNRIRVRIDGDSIRCFVNGELAIESDDGTFSSGRVGLAKFRDTEADFRRFAIGKDLSPGSLSEDNRQWLEEISQDPARLQGVTAAELETAASNSQIVAGHLEREAFELTQRAERMRRLAADVRLTPVLNQLGELGESEEPEDLVRGALLIAALDNPQLDIDSYLQRLEEMAEDIRIDLPEAATIQQRMEALDTYLFEENGFHGGRDEYYHPANSHLNRVIDDREGLPITLSILYIDLARRLSVTVDGIGLPGHFVVNRPVDNPQPADDEAAPQPERSETPAPTGELVDVFDRGKVLGQQDAAMLTLQFAGRTVQQSDLEPQTVTQILTRVLNNLIGSAQRENDLEALYRYTEALVAIRPQDPQFRMMRVIILHQTDRDQRALEDLEWLIEQQPAELDLQKLIRMRDFLRQ